MIIIEGDLHGGAVFFVCAFLGGAFLGGFVEYLDLGKGISDLDWASE